MKLSIIVPVYKAEKYLHRCVDSLLAQNVEDMEILLINDGSPDASQAIIDEYVQNSGGRVRALLQENGGQARARNAGIDIARGDWLGFVDSDDWVLPEMFSTLLARAEAEEADLAVCGFFNCHEDGRRDPAPARRRDHPLAAAGSVWNKLFRRSLVAELRFPEGLWYEDLAFSTQLLLRSKKTVYLEEPLYCYRIGHPSTMNNQNARKNLDMLRVMELLRQDMEALGCDRSLFEDLVIQHVLLDSINRLSLQHSPEKLEVIARLRAYVHAQVPELRRCESYRSESRSRRVVMRLNDLGLEDISRLLLNIKKKLG